MGSLIARSTKCGVYLNAGREHAVASTKAFTTQVAALALVAGWYAQNRHAQAGAAVQELLTGAVDAQALTPAVGGGKKGGAHGAGKHSGAGGKHKAGNAEAAAVAAAAASVVSVRPNGSSINISQRRADLIESIHRLPTYTGRSPPPHLCSLACCTVLCCAVR